METIDVRRVVEILGETVVRVIGQTDRVISHPAPIHEARSDLAITFCNKIGDEAAELIGSTKAGVILCRDDQALGGLLCRGSGKTLVVVQHPRLTFLRLVAVLFAEPRQVGIHSTAVIDPGAKIHPTVCIGPFTYVGKCEIGEGSVVYGHAHIYSRARIGRNVIIHAGAMVGADGFGYERNESGKLEKFPHVGGVVIEDDVEIGSNTCIDRGTLGDTIIREGAKIDNLVHIAHNVVVGRHAVVIADAMIGGSVRIGDYSWVAPSVCLREGLSIGEKTTIGMGSVVLKDVPDGMRVIGSPARPIDEYKRILRGLARFVTGAASDDDI